MILLTELNRLQTIAIFPGMNTPNKHYDFVYVIVRYDPPSEISCLADPQNTWHAVKVVLTEEEADTECKRLNMLYQHRLRKWGMEESLRAPYYWGQTHIQKGILRPDAPSN